MSNPSPPSGRGRERRRRKFIRRDLQLKIILGALLISLVVLVFNYSLFLVGLSIFKRSLSVENLALWSPVNYLVMVSFFIGVAVSVPMAIWLGVSFSFTFCGPIYAIKRYFVDLKEGLWTSRCRLRTGDDLQDVKDAINESLDLFRARLTAQTELLAEAETLLGSDAPPDRQRVASVLERLRAERAELERRFPVSDHPAVPSGEAKPNEASEVNEAEELKEHDATPA